jgi:hypothetical protein
MGRERGIGTTDWHTLRPREVAIDAEGRVQRYALAVPDLSDPAEVARAINLSFVT